MRPPFTRFTGNPTAISISEHRFYFIIDIVAVHDLMTMVKSSSLDSHTKIGFVEAGRDESLRGDMSPYVAR